MKYQELVHHFKAQKYFSLNQIRLYEPDFLVQNIYNRIDQGYLKQITKWWYCFNDSTFDESTVHTIATTIYTPAYISMESGLRRYDLIPEWVPMITWITTKKTQYLETSLGNWKWYHIHPKHFWGYALVKSSWWGSFRIAEPEKVLCDFFYLKSHLWRDDFVGLRIDPWQRKEHISEKKLFEYAQRFWQKRLLRTITDFIYFMHHD